MGGSSSPSGCRSIPDKPPPPYTPPASPSGKSAPPRSHTSPRRSQESEDSPEIVKYEVPHTQKDVSEALAPMTEALFKARREGRELKGHELSQISNTALGTQYKSKEVYLDFLAELALEITASLYGDLNNKDEEEEVNKQLWKRPLRLPTSPNELQVLVEREAAILLGLERRAVRENLVVRWSQKPRDRVDEILVRELHGEEASWTDYSKDAAVIIESVAVDVIAEVLADTAKEVKRVRL